MESIKVIVRCRPLNSKETKEGRSSIVNINKDAGQVTLGVAGKDADDKQKTFSFDAVYDENCTQKEVYEESAFSLVTSVLEGFNCTIFAYGQTGCGKTWTMTGRKETPDESEKGLSFRGIIPNSFDHIFECIKAEIEKSSEEKGEGKLQFLVRASYLEIYNEEIKDLLAKDSQKSSNLEVKEANGVVYVKDLTFAHAETPENLFEILENGTKKRSVGATAMNAESSRSHSLFSIVVERKEVNDLGEDVFRVGKLNLVDLAGSERQSKTEASGSRLKEGCKINLSLSALGNVISALVENSSKKRSKKFVPYRDSKLTRLLQDSLGGNTKTVMISNISPADYNFEETLSTLRYADRAKKIKNKPVVNEDPKDALLRKYQEEIKELRAKLRTSGTDERISNADEKPGNENVLEKESELAKEVSRRKELEERLAAIEGNIIDRSGNVDQTNMSYKTIIERNEARAKKLEDIHRRREEEKERLYVLAQESETRDFEQEYESMKENVSEKQKAFQILKKKLKKKTAKLKTEMQDLEEEFEQEKDDLLETIREQNREIKRYQQLLDRVFTQEEQSVINNQAQWHEDQGCWQLPQVKVSSCLNCRRRAHNTGPFPSISDAQSRRKSVPAGDVKSLVDQSDPQTKSSPSISRTIQEIKQEVETGKFNNGEFGGEEINYSTLKIKRPNPQTAVRLAPLEVHKNQ